MMIRGLQADDLSELKEIHEKYYKKEFELPDFFDKYLCAFSVIDDDKLIVVGGVRTIAESVIITNKDLAPRKRYDALLQVLEASKYISAGANYNQLHAFVQNDRWKTQLTKFDFKPCKGQAFFVDV